MNRLNILIKTFLALLGAGFFSLILYVSILGENHKIDYQVARFFDALKTRDYDLVCNILSKKSTGSVFNDDRPCMESSFLLELAFLTRYGLLASSDYTVVIRRTPFWIPFLSGDTISVSVAFSEKKNNIVEKFFHDMDDDAFIDHFITVSRQKGSWIIDSVNLESSSLYPRYQELASKVDLNRFVTETGQGFQLNQGTIDPATLSPLERRVLDFSLNKLTHKRRD